MSGSLAALLTPRLTRFPRMSHWCHIYHTHTHATTRTYMQGSVAVIHVVKLWYVDSKHSGSCKSFITHHSSSGWCDWSMGVLPTLICIIAVKMHGLLWNYYSGMIVKWILAPCDATAFMCQKAVFPPMFTLKCSLRRHVYFTIMHLWFHMQNSTETLTGDKVGWFGCCFNSIRAPDKGS